MKTLTDALTSGKPFILVVGRKRQLIKEPMRLEMTRDVQPLWDDPLAPLGVMSETIQLFIANKLFATSMSVPRSRYSRSPIRIVKPKRGRLEVRLTKKLNRFAHSDSIEPQ